MFDLHRPCSNCPFKKGQGSMFALGASRIDEIVEATAFQCHKTKEKKPQQCAGLMAMLVKENKPNQIMQVGSRLKALDLDKLDPDNESYDSIQQAKQAHVNREEPDEK